MPHEGAPSVFDGGIEIHLERFATHAVRRDDGGESSKDELIDSWENLVLDARLSKAFAELRPQI